MINLMVEFFEKQSAIANFLQIAGGLIGGAMGLWHIAKRIWRRRIEGKNTTLSGWLATRTYSPTSASSLKVAVVDDRPEDYPLDTLRRLGYSIAHIGHLSLADIPSLLAYDCILLDINGVLDEDTKNGGLQILKRLKISDGPYVVAVSSKGFDITMSEFFMLADHRLKKPIPPAEVEGIIQKAFENRYSAKDAAIRIDQNIFSELPQTSTKKAAFSAVRKYLETGTHFEDVKDELAIILSGERLSTTIIDIKIVRRSLSRS